MKNLWSSFKNQYSSLSTDEKWIVGAVISIFLPVYITVPIVIVVTIRAYIKYGFFAIFEEVSKGKYLLLSSIMVTLCAVFFKNWYGLAAGVGFIVFVFFIVYYQSMITKDLFILLMKIACIMSLVSFVVGIFQYIAIVNHFQYPTFSFQIENDPMYRVDSVYFNANYYAMMCEFFVMIALYLFLFDAPGQRKKYYIFVIMCNLAGLYLTGCRTGWFPFLIAVPAMFYITKQYKYFYWTAGIMLALFIVFIFNPDILPRDDGVSSSFTVRLDIWRTAIEGIQMNPIFGRGLLTYMQIYDMFGGPYTQHAHNVILDPILSFGVIPLIFFLVYYLTLVKNIFTLYIRNISRSLFALILSFLLITFMHGMLDYTIQWVSTYLLFSIVLGSVGIYFRKGEEREEYKVHHSQVKVNKDESNIRV